MTRALPFPKDSFCLSPDSAPGKAIEQALHCPEANYPRRKDLALKALGNELDRRRRLPQQTRRYFEISYRVRTSLTGMGPGDGLRLSEEARANGLEFYGSSIYAPGGLDHPRHRTRDIKGRITALHRNRHVTEQQRSDLIAWLQGHKNVTLLRVSALLPSIPSLKEGIRNFQQERVTHRALAAQFDAIPPAGWEIDAEIRLSPKDPPPLRKNPKRKSK